MLPGAVSQGETSFQGIGARRGNKSIDKVNYKLLRLSRVTANPSVKPIFRDHSQHFLSSPLVS
jgi:hypothetical protein